MKHTIVSIFWRRFRDDRRGNVAMIAALSMLGLVGTAGIGIDYFNALAAKSRLDLASDAAAIAAINAAQSYIEANSGTQTDPALNGGHNGGQGPSAKCFQDQRGVNSQSRRDADRDDGAVRADIQRQHHLSGGVAECVRTDFRHQSYHYQWRLIVELDHG
ncbi:MAG TPA: hypothetical protein VFC11_00525 [Methylocella sp.]|nr:hypothetical protein [Methylocella sp.]